MGTPFSLRAPWDSGFSLIHFHDGKSQQPGRSLSLYQGAPTFLKAEGPSLGICWHLFPASPLQSSSGSWRVQVTGRKGSSLLNIPSSLGTIIGLLCWVALFIHSFNSFTVFWNTGVSTIYKICFLTFWGYYYKYRWQEIVAVTNRMPTGIPKLRCKGDTIQVKSLQIGTHTLWTKLKVLSPKTTEGWLIWITHPSPWLVHFYANKGSKFNTVSLGQITWSWLVGFQHSDWSLRSHSAWSVNMQMKIWLCNSDWTGQVPAHWLKGDSRNSFIRVDSANRNTVHRLTAQPVAFPWKPICLRGLSYQWLLVRIFMPN